MQMNAGYRLPNSQNVLAQRAFQMQQNPQMGGMPVNFGPRPISAPMPNPSMWRAPVAVETPNQMPAQPPVQMQPPTAIQAPVQQQPQNVARMRMMGRF